MSRSEIRIRGRSLRDIDRVAEARVARLATINPDGSPHVVPIVFALTGADRLVTAVDWKPKKTARLQRLANIERDPRVSVLVDEYDDADWSALWWVRIEGVASVVEPGGDGYAEAIAALVEKYEQYRDNPPAGAAIVVEIGTVRAWSGASADADTERGL